LCMTQFIIAITKYQSKHHVPFVASLKERNQEGPKCDTAQVEDIGSHSSTQVASPNPDSVRPYSHFCDVYIRYTTIPSISQASDFLLVDNEPLGHNIFELRKNIQRTHPLKRSSCGTARLKRGQALHKMACWLRLRNTPWLEL
jgi:hypothetical protein